MPNQESQTGKFNNAKLFRIGVLALFTAALSFALRAASASDIQIDYFNPIDALHAAEMTGAALGVSFLGFAITLFATSPFLDAIGIGRMLRFAALAFIVGPLLIATAGIVAEGRNVYHLVYLGMLINGFGWGAVESSINPMTAALYPVDKTHRMNVLHAWWPAGLVAGGLLGLGLAALDVDWRIGIMMISIPALVFAWWSFGETYPQTERLTMGVEFKDSIAEIFRRPSFFIWLAAMFLTASSELAPGQWVDFALTHTVGMRGIILLVYISSIMFVMRHFAGPIAEKLSPVGLLWFSSLLAMIGLYLLSRADSPATAIVAATVWGIGVCFMWPTMLAVAAEQYPRGGAWTIGLMGTAGSLAIYFVLPQLGKVYDQAKIAAAGGAEALAGLSGAELEAVTVSAARSSFETVAIFPFILLFVFGGLWTYQYLTRHRL
jgi:hypothetical protein